MGVAGLWEVLKPAATVRSLTHLAVKDGFEANPGGKRGFRLGIDASIWFFHAEYGREGENPVLRTLFFRCATLMHTTFLPLFVFDGPKRPDVKRGKKINRTNHKLIPGMKQIVEAFGFEWRMAPGEAEAELAYLNRIGVIDGILSDDVDNFLFGAKTVIRNSSNTLSGNRANPTLNSAGKDDKNHSRIFRADDIREHSDIRLTRGGMILIGLMSGGDYHQGGLARCGVATAHALARCGFGDSLYKAAITLDRESLQDFLVSWRDDVRQELRTNSKGEIGRKQVALANSISEKFPDIDILLSYISPITSESLGRESNNLRITWETEPDLAKLAGVCELYFEWGYKEAIIKRFRTVIWHSVVLRILRRAVLDLDHGRTEKAAQGTPKKRSSAQNKTLCGTPSKMIAKHFSSLSITSPAKVYISGSEEEDEEDRLVVKVHSSRTHPSTDGLPEYRLEIAPRQLVQMTESGIKGLRSPEGPDEWASEEVEDGEGEGRKGGQKVPLDPHTHLRVWMPASMAKLVEPELVSSYENLQEQKRMEKGSRNTASKQKAPRRKKKTTESTNLEVSDVFSAPPVKKKSNKKVPSAKTKHTLSLSRIHDEGSSGSEHLPKSIMPQTTHRVSGEPIREPSPSPADEDDDYNFFLKTKTGKKTHDGLSDDFVTRPSKLTGEEIFSISAKSRSGIRDLTRKKRQASSTNVQVGIKSFFPVTHALTAKALSSQTTTTQMIRDTEVLSPSPSKRKERANGVRSTSESDLGDHVKKSPRKKRAQTSPHRPASPSPSPSKSRLKKPMAVIEISSESDLDSCLPVKPLPPLMRAKARVASSQNSSAHLRTQLEDTDISSDIIDLT